MGTISLRNVASRLAPRLLAASSSVGGIRSTGLTASMAIGEYVVELLLEAGLDLGDRRTAAPPPMADNTANDHVVVVRAYDRFDNLATAKTVLRGK